MNGERIRLRPREARGSREQTLRALLDRQPGREAELAGWVEDAQVCGSLELSGIPVAWDEVRGVRHGGTASPQVLGLREALAAVGPTSPLDMAAFDAWATGLLGRRDPWRRTEALPRGVSSPAALVSARLRSLGEWIEGESGRQLTPAAAAAVVMARVAEIRPLDDGNARLARLAASHVLVRRGRRPAVLVQGDAPRLAAALAAARALDTAGLVELLDEASDRAVDLMLKVIDPAAAGPGP